MTKLLLSLFLSAIGVASAEEGHVGDRIILLNDTNVRSSPGIKQVNLIGMNPVGTLGTLVEGPAAGTGAYAWWKIDYDGINAFDGWSGEDNLALSSVPAPTPTPVPTPIPTPEPISTPAPTPIEEGMWNVSGTVIKTPSGFRIDLFIED